MENRNSGFLQIIVAVVVLLFVLRFFGLTISELYYWFKSLFFSVL